MLSSDIYRSVSAYKNPMSLSGYVTRERLAHSLIFFFLIRKLISYLNNYYSTLPLTVNEDLKTLVMNQEFTEMIL